MGKRYFSNKIVKWYSDNLRPLPWRETTDPYKIWLSEVILQQTRVAQGLPYYQQFVSRYPSVEHLARASEQEVLRLWQGLGYYSRARNLHQCAKLVAGQYNGRFPTSAQGLEALPGIGHYTAAAIASISFGERVAVLDGNVYRVLARVFGIDTSVNTPQGLKVFSTLANELVPKANPAVHNQAVMEFGALFCTPRNPRCDDCPLQRSCIAFQRNMVELLPVKRAKKKSRNRYFFYVVLEKNNAFLMRKRQEKDIWQGLFDFPLVERSRPVQPHTLIEEGELKKWSAKADVVKISPEYKHVLTHQTIYCRFIHVKAKSIARKALEGLAFYTAEEIVHLPKPVLITRFLDKQNAL